MNIREERLEGGEDGEKTQYVCDLYTIRRTWSEGLAEEVETNYDEWLETAMEESEPAPTVEDVMEAVNLLTEIMLGGDEDE